MLLKAQELGLAVAELRGRQRALAPGVSPPVGAARRVTPEVDVLVVGYVSRFLRNLKQTLDVVEDQLKPAGVAILFADERILSSDLTLASSSAKLIGLSWHFSTFSSRGPPATLRGKEYEGQSRLHWESGWLLHVCGSAMNCGSTL